MSEWTPLQREAPYKFIRNALKLFQQNNGKIIVEIGCIRQRFNHPIEHEPVDCPSRLDGHSTVHWAHSGAEFYTVDICQKNIDLANEYVSGYPNTKCFCMDGIKFLKNFNKPIDLLFLDAWDVDLSDCAERHLEAYNVALPHMAPKGLILIDDCDVSMVDGKLHPAVSIYGGKGEMVVPTAINNGYKVVLKGRCVLLEPRF